MATDIIAIGVSLTALGVSVVTFYIGHTRVKKSQEIRISREISDRIYAQEGIVEKWTMEDQNSHDTLPPINAMDSLTNELDYFVYLTENGEIKDSTIREYYRKRLLPIFRTVKYVNAWSTDSEYTLPEEILLLIEKYHKITGKMDEYRKEFVST